MRFTDRWNVKTMRRRVALDDVRNRLWNDSTDRASYDNGGEKYQSAIMEQYKIYVEMADRVGARRATTNTFFLLVNTGIFTLLANLQRSATSRSLAVLVLAVVVLVLQCGVWYWTLRSYRQLSSVKFRVIGAIEERLPASPWLRAEWGTIGSGKDRRAYWPVIQLEQLVPMFFAMAYVALFVLLLVT
ncbi:RipA family octameric membrane protein [Micromonospora zhanjiangensis]|uniref:Small integral membrane protein n=1 Tax=Micromonospora zhanjiangensis TaxID=1522057 RepID=A0ABV8KRC4_9ACTN